MQVRRRLVKVHDGVEHFEVRIACFKSTHILIKHLLCKFDVFGSNGAVVNIAELHDDLLKGFLLLSFSDMFIVVGNDPVTPFHSGIVFGERFSEQLGIKFTDILFFVGYIVRYPFTDYVLRNETAVIVFDDTIVNSERYG